jgi:hypothetical protein
MSTRRVAGGASITATLVVVAVIAATAVPAGQTKTSQNGQTGSISRTASGHPDLQGVWNFSTLTPLERPAEFAGKTVLSEKEAADYERSLLGALDHDTREGAERACKGTGNYNEFWYDRGSSVVKTRRTSLIVDPPDGKIPALTPEGIKQRDMRAAVRKSRGPSDSWVDRGLGERCMIGFNAGPPMMPSAYNNNFQLFQTADYVVIHTEMVHESRIVPLDGRPHLPATVRPWMGDSRGHWEGDTLVVETTNFNAKNVYRGASENLRLVERFSRSAEGMLLYEFTIDDPATWTLPWTGRLPLEKVDGQIYEYACHEANYGMTGILKGTRADEASAAAGTTK